MALVSESERPVGWRRRLGAAAAPFLVILALAALLLNHGRELGLEPAALRALLRDDPAPDAGLAQRLPAGELAAVGGRLRLGERDLGACPRLVGVVEQADRVLAVCSDRLWLLAPDGRVMAAADHRRGVPQGLSAVGLDAGRVLLRAGTDPLAVDLQDLSLHPAPAGVTWGAPGREASPVADASARRPPPYAWLGGPLPGPATRLVVDVLALLCLAVALGLLLRRRRLRRAEARAPL